MNRVQYRQLYDFCQTLNPKVSRKVIVPKIVQITGTTKVRTIMTNIDTKVSRGYFLSCKNVDHQFVRTLGHDVIVLARGMNKCWERFVNTKELMHLFDDNAEKTDSPEKFVELLSDFEAAPDDLSPQARSDAKGVWMALACLCPEKRRLEFEALRAKARIDNYKIALELRIPEYYVPWLFNKDYRKTIDDLIRDDHAVPIGAYLTVAK